MIPRPDATRPRRILCLGMPVRDMTFRVTDVPARGDKIQASRFDEICGGNAPNAAVAIARLSGQARLSGPMGDAREQGVGFLLEKLASEGIETQHVVHVAGALTPLSTILIDDSGERTGITYRDPALWHVDLPPSAALLDGVDAILAESRCASFIMAVCEEARARGIPVVVDADRPMSTGDALLQTATHVIFSAEALRASASTEDLTAALAQLAASSPAFLGVTDGAQGITWRDAKGAARHTPAFPVTAVDTLGAGDVFHGAFTLAIAEGSALAPALRFAAAAAALKTTRFGGAFAAPQRAEVQALLDR